MPIMHQILDTTERDIETLLTNAACGTCLEEVYNDWLICIRKSAQLNLHPELIARERQAWLISVFPVKYLILPAEYSGPVFNFNGLLTPRYQTLILKDATLPIKSRKTNVLTYGKFLFIQRIDYEQKILSSKGSDL